MTASGGKGWTGHACSPTLAPRRTTSAYASTYNAKATPKQVLGTWRNFQQKESAQELLMAYGFGDGGGGPTREMLENIREMGDFPATPRSHAKRRWPTFSATWKQSAGDQLPTWNGELYLEIHRGTYTTQSRNKRANRKSEFLLHDAEFAAALASVLQPDAGYPDGGTAPGLGVGLSEPVPRHHPRQQHHARLCGIPAAIRRDPRASANGCATRRLTTVAAQMDADLLIVNPTGFARA